MAGRTHGVGRGVSSARGSSTSRVGFNRRRKIFQVVSIVLVAVFGLTYTFLVGNEPLLGLDLQGGASVVLEPTESVDQESLDVAVEIIRNRVDGLGVAEPEISTQGGNILVQLPGVENQQRAIELVGKTAELRFRPVLAYIKEPEYREAVLTCLLANDVVAAVESDVTEVESVAAVEPEAETADTPPLEPVDATQDAAATEACRTARYFDLTRTRADVDVESVDVEVTLASYFNVPTSGTGGGGGTDAASAVSGGTDAASVPDVDASAISDADTDSGLGNTDSGIGSGTDNISIRYRLGPTDVTGDGLEGANSVYQPVTLYNPTGGWTVNPLFKGGADGIDKFNALSERCYRRDLTCPGGKTAIEIDNEVLSAPEVQGGNASGFVPFTRSNIQITGDFSEEEAKDLALVLEYGALPVDLEAQQSRIVSASLGTDALRAGVVAAVVGLALVSLFLVGYYRLLGLVAILSLALSAAMLWVIIAWLGNAQGLALTLSGVTGLIVAIGVSVDSNVVYFEHLKEEIRAGRTLRSATDRAFPVAFSTIVKADVASLIAAAVLYVLTVGQVRGFALYLGLATILDLVATYFFMGPLIALIAQRRGVKANLRNLGMPSVDRDELMLAVDQNQRSQTQVQPA